MKPFSIYFPQFYATPTNDRAWGKGFTDWALVANANLHDNWTRRAPARGFYDGADAAVHEAQMDEMVANGLGGMAVYHYWFYTHQELPVFERTLLSGGGRPALPWFLVWASEGWSRRWLGDSAPIATLSPDPTGPEIEAHCAYLMRCFEQPSYYRWKGKPLFVWYHLGHFVDPPAVVERYRECLLRLGTEIVVGHFVKNPSDVVHCPSVDLTYLFEPRLYFGLRRAGRGVNSQAAFEKIRQLIGEAASQRLLTLLDWFQQKGHTYPADDHLRYLGGEQRARLVASLPSAVQEVISPGWNNTPRYDRRYTALEGLPAQRFGELVRAASARPEVPPPLINAWNEWSEGAAIEPCAYFGTRFLEALAGPDRAIDDAMERAAGQSR
ncbi:MAG: glycoside hydrolase family 99-like domain-containing protein [Caldimonas sp.]